LVSLGLSGRGNPLIINPTQHPKPDSKIKSCNFVENTYNLQRQDHKEAVRILSQTSKDIAKINQKDLQRKNRIVCLICHSCKGRNPENYRIIY